MKLIMFLCNHFNLSFLLLTVLNEGVYCQTNCPVVVPPSPCTCSYANDGVNIDLDCSDAASEIELQNYFESFPAAKVQKLTIASNSALPKLSQNVFGDVTFESIYLSDDVMEYIDEAAFSKSNSTLIEWRIEDCMLLPQGFPFYTIESYLVLETLVLSAAGKFDVLPRITSNSLTTLAVLGCELMFLDHQSTIGLPTLKYLYLYENNISVLHPGTFDNNPLLEQVYLYGNLIEELSLGTFRNLENLTLINLGYNKIHDIQPGAFYNLTKLEMLYLRNNLLQMFLWQMIGDLPSLTNLYVDENRIGYFDRDLLRNSPKIRYFFSSYNNLTSIPKGTFDNLHTGYLLLEHNSLTTLNENWLLMVLQNKNLAFLSYNPLECGCDLAWLMADITLLSGVTASCANGTSIRELDSSFFVSNCTTVPST